MGEYIKLIMTANTERKPMWECFFLLDDARVVQFYQCLRGWDGTEFPGGDFNHEATTPHKELVRNILRSDNHEFSDDGTSYTLSGKEEDFKKLKEMFLIEDL